MGTAALALSGLARRRRESLTVLAVLILSFAAGLLSLSLLGSMSRTNEEYKFNTYGEWYGAIIDGREEDAGWLEEREWLDGLGTARLFGRVWDDTGRFYGMGTVDDGYRSLARLRLDEGRWPEADGEAAVEAQLLIDLGYEPTVGQTVAMRVSCNQFGGLEPMGFFVDYTFTVCGVIHDYSQLWEIDHNRVSRPLIGAVATDAAWEQMVESCEAQSVYVWDRVDEWRFEQVPEYFFSVRGGGLDAKEKLEIKNYLLSTRSAAFEDVNPSYNSLNDPEALDVRNDRGAADSGNVTVEDEGLSQPRTGDTYQALILAVTLIAVLCVYVLQFPRQAHNYAVFRAVGASRWKLAGIILWETLLLCVPAALLGAGLGAALTWAALRIWIYGGSSVEIQVFIPLGGIGRFALLWAAAALIARAAVFLFAVRIPLTGRFRLGSGRVRGARRLTTALALFLGCAAVATLLFSVRSARNTVGRIRSFSRVPDYDVRAGDASDLKAVFSQEDVELLRSVPGVAYANAYSAAPVEVSFPGVSEANATLLAVDEADEYWDFLPFDGEEDRRAFREGKFVFVLDLSLETYWRGEQTVTLTAHETGPEWRRMERLLASRSLPARAVASLPPTLSGAGDYKYAVFCSHGFLESLLADMEPDVRWGSFITGSEYGYKGIYLEETGLADDLAAGVTLERLLGGMGAAFTDQGAMFAAMIRSLQNSMVLTCAVGLCVTLIALLLMTGVLSLETQRERRRYTLLRILGLSRRSMRLTLVKSALGRSALASAVGWCAFGAYMAYGLYASVGHRGMRYVLELTAAELTFGGRYALAAALALGGLGLLFALITLSKRELLKGGADDVHDITSAGTV